MTDFYYPSQQVNTIGNWDYNTGYQLKAENDFELTLTGSKIANPSVEIGPPGWDILPVLTSCEVPVAEVLFDGNEPLQFVKEVAGSLVFWPVYGINTLQTLVPGKAYYTVSPDAGFVTFPDCTKSSTVKQQISRPENFTPWNNLHYSAASHVIAFPADVLAKSGISVGDAIGVFTPEGLCAGRTEITNLSSGISVSAFADDETTFQNDGFAYGEMLQFKVFRPSTNEEISLVVDYVASLPNTNYPDFSSGGIFVANGLSAVKHLKLQALGEQEITEFDIRVFPNPSTGNINLTLNTWPANLKIYIIDTRGSIHQIVSPGALPGGSLYKFDVGFLPKGMYYLKLIDGNIIGREKIVVQ